jgi:hypothetical protein
VLHRHMNTVTLCTLPDVGACNTCWLCGPHQYGLCQRDIARTSIHCAVTDAYHVPLQLPTHSHVHRWAVWSSCRARSGG